MRYLVRLVTPMGGVVLDPFLGCYDESTRVATGRGFIRWPEVREDDLFLSRSLGGRLSMEAATAFQRRRYAGPMYHFTGRSLDLLVTPEHQMLVREHHELNTKLVPARSMNKRWYGIPNKSAAWVGPDRDVPFGLPCTYEDWLRFLGLYLAEGYVLWTGRGQAIYVKQSKSREAIDLVRWILQGLGVHVGERERSGVHVFWVSHPGLKAFCKSLGRQIDRRIPRSAMTGGSLNALLEGLVAGDGLFKALTEDAPLTYFTSSPGLALDVAELFVKMGHAASVTSRAPRTPTIRGRVVEPRNVQYTVLARYAHETKIDTYKRVSVEQYAGTVYCATVPPNHTLLVERNGCVAWCGNSGTTGMAAMLEGVNFIGIEREEEYLHIAKARIEAVLQRGAP